MNFVIKFFEWLNSYVEKPPMYGIYHLMWIFCLVFACIIFAIINKRKNNSDKLCKTTLLICWILLVVLEAIKELMVGFSVDSNNKIHFAYNYVYFPYQLCSLPFYVLPFVIFIKNEKIKQFFISSTTSFIILGGALFVLIPAGFKNTLYLNFHTMAHHCLQVFTSFVCIIWYKDRICLKNFIKSSITLVITMTLAIIFNIVIYKSGRSVQLWNLSPYIVFDLEILEKIRVAIGYVPYVILYLVILSLLSLGVYMLPKLFKKRKTN